MIIWKMAIIMGLVNTAFGIFLIILGKTNTTDYSLAGLILFLLALGIIGYGIVTKIRYGSNN